MKTTICKKCGKEVKYIKVQPDYCSVCRPEAEKVPKITKSYQGKWKGENKIFYLLSKTLDVECITNGYYSFLQSPNGAPMQLDWYCPEFKFAVEIMGDQHYKYTKYFHKSKSGFEYLKKCDDLKAKLCKDLGIELVYIKPNETLTQSSLLAKFSKGLIKRLQNKIIKENN